MKKKKNKLERISNIALAFCVFFMLILTIYKDSDFVSTLRADYKYTPLVILIIYLGIELIIYIKKKKL